MRIAAYVLLADPNYLAASIASYYEVVDEIVLSYDVNRLGWGGDPIPIDESIEQSRMVDPERKIRLLAGSYSRPGQSRLESETIQRQDALDEASKSADWVLQIDVDEIVPEPAALAAQVAQAEVAGAEGLDFPSLWLFARSGPNRYLVLTDRWWRLASGYPGPLAVRTGTQLRHCRQIGGQLWRVDIGRTSRDPAQPRSRVDAVVPAAAAVRHFSWARTEDQMLWKSQTSGHADDFDWHAALERWRRANRHPWLYSLATPFRSRHTGSSGLPGGWVRPIELDDVEALLVRA